MRWRFFGSTMAVAMIAVQGAWAFGTVEGLGQRAEHERITRHALACGQPGGLPQTLCFEPASMNEMGGENKTFGAVGAPDNPTRGLMSVEAAHCDSGDYLDTAGYPHSQQAAQNALFACRTWMVDHLNLAVDDAGKIVKNHKINDSEIPTIRPCLFNGHKGGLLGRAKCDAFEEFGLTLHASQDFYSHTNWVDRPRAGEPTSIYNPPGLGKTGRAPWLDLRKTSPFPYGLMSGCYEHGSKSVLTDPNGVAGCQGRVTHYVLNKDKGQIDPQFSPGTTPRGQINDNFRHAVEAAIDDTRDKWATLRERIVQKYGPQDGNLIICGLTHDNPAKTCH